MARIGRYGCGRHTSGETIGLLRKKFPQSIQELKEKIRAVIDEIKPQMCENVMENFIKRAWS